MNTLTSLRGVLTLGLLLYSTLYGVLGSVRRRPVRANEALLLGGRGQRRCAGVCHPALEREPAGAGAD